LIVALAGALCTVPLWAFASGMGGIVAGALLMQFMVQGAWGIVPAHISELAPDQIRGFLPGFAYQCGNLIAASIGWTQAVLAERYDYPYVMAASAAVIFLGAIAAVALGREQRGIVFGAGQAGTP
jgi:MFS transporter, SHS family, lactate transporter